MNENVTSFNDEINGYILKRVVLTQPFFMWGYTICVRFYGLSVNYMDFGFDNRYII